MWSCKGEWLLRRKVESGLMFRRCLVRLYEETWRQVGGLMLAENRDWTLLERRSLRGLLSNLASISGGAA